MLRCRSGIRRLASFSSPSICSNGAEVGELGLTFSSERIHNFIRRLSGLAALLARAEPASGCGQSFDSAALCRASLVESGISGSGKQFFARQYAAEASKEDYREEVDDINSKFAEARDDIEMALESKETVYFNTEMEAAKASVKEVLDKYQALLARLPEADKGVIQRSMGLKMEQLKAELQQLLED